MGRVSIGLVLALLSCSSAHKLKFPAEYHAKDNPHYKASVYYVGANWQIKDAVNRGETPDHWTYHTPEFWDHPKDELLVTFHLEAPASVADGVWPLERFEKFFAESSK